MRRPIGQVTLALNLVIAIFVVGSLGLVSYEMSRILLAREQLKHCLELAALGGGAAMASTNLSGQPARDRAKIVAMNILKKNSILGLSLQNDSTEVTSMSAMRPNTKQVTIFFEFDDPVTKLPVPVNQDANVLRVYGAYAYPLFSGGFGSIGVNVYTVIADAVAGLPAMDVMVVIDSSGSEDDQTAVTFVRRYWNPNAPDIAYLIPNPGLPEEGPIRNIVCGQTIGTDVNALPPQNLDAAGDPKVAGCPKEFSETGPSGTTSPLRGVSDVGAPPGDAPAAAGGAGLLGMGPGTGNTQTSVAFNPARINKNRAWENFAHSLSRIHLEQPAQAWFTPNYDQGSQQYNPWGADPSCFTDCVVNLDGANHFTTFTGPGSFAAYPFRDLGYLTEAARGNLDSNNLCPNAHTDNAMANDAQPGYQMAYQYLALQQLQPKRTIEDSVKTFMTKLNQTSDVHFGFVAYNDIAGVAPNTSKTTNAVSWAWPRAGTVKYLIPKIDLNPGNANPNPSLGAINALLTPPAAMGAPNGNIPPLYVPNGGSNLADGLAKALESLLGANSRTGAFKAIVVVTDKVPTRDLAGTIYQNPGANGPALADAIAKAQVCSDNGIPIFVIALDQTGGQMTPFFNNQFSDTTAGGLVNTAGHGGVLYVDQWAGANATTNSLQLKFNNVIRQLMTLVQG